MDSAAMEEGHAEEQTSDGLTTTADPDQDEPTMEPLRGR